MGKVIKLFGERNSGTRAVKQILRNAADLSLQPNSPNASTHMNICQSLRDVADQTYHENWWKLYLDALHDTCDKNPYPICAWTHAAPNWDMAFLHNQIDVIFMVRNPYSWALSTACKPYQMKGPRTASFAQFLTRPWLTERRDNVSVVLPSVIDLWTTKVTAYRDFAQISAEFGMTRQFISFEAFVKAPEQEICTALQTLGISTTGVLKGKNNSNSGEGFSQNAQEYYNIELWKKRLTRSTVALINTRLDWDLIEHFGYKKLNPIDFPDKLPDLEQWRFSHEMMSLNPQPNLRVSNGSHRKRRATPAA